MILDSMDRVTRALVLLLLMHSLHRRIPKPPRPQSWISPPIHLQLVPLSDPRWPRYLAFEFAGFRMLEAQSARETCWRLPGCCSAILVCFESSFTLKSRLRNKIRGLHASQYAVSTAPEGGDGWTVVAACFGISFWVVGTFHSWGVMQAALFKQGLSSPPTMSWIGSLAFACIAFLALINARVIRLLGARGTVFLGIFMLALRQVSSDFCTQSVGDLFVTAGVVSGTGRDLNLAIKPQKNQRRRWTALINTNNENWKLSKSKSGVC